MEERIINPANAGSAPVDKLLLKKILLEKMDPNGILKTSDIYTFTEPQEYAIALTNKIIRRQSKGEYRYEVLGKRLGEGTFSRVYEVLVTLKINSQDELEFKFPEPNKQKIVKKLKLLSGKMNDEQRFEYLITEHELLSRLSIFRVKMPVVTYFDNPFYLIEHRFQGTNLYDLLIDKNVHFTEDQRILICIRILKFLLRLHQFDIIHHDIKPENIIVEPSTLEIGIIDLGMGKSVEKNSTGYRLGTSLYASPESFAYQNTYFSTDVFSLSRVFSEIWGAHECLLDKQKEGDVGARFKDVRFTAQYCDEVKLFDNITFLNENHKHLITQLLGEMSYRDPSRRCSVHHALSIFESIQLERTLIHTPIKYHPDVIYAHKQALNIREYSDLPHLLKFTEYTLKFMPDSPRAIREFLTTLDIKEWFSFKTKNKIIHEISNLLHRFNHHVKQLNDLVDQIQDQEQREPMIDFLDKMIHYPLNITDLFEYNHKMESKINKLSAQGHIAYHSH